MRPAKTQINLGIRPVWSESSLSAWNKLGSLATHWAHREDSDQTGRMPRLIWVFAGRTLILLVLSCRGSFVISFILTVQPMSSFQGNNQDNEEQYILTRLRLDNCSGNRDLSGFDHQWATTRQNQQTDPCAKRRLRSLWASAQSDQGLRWPHEETLLLSFPFSAQRRLWSDCVDAQADPSLCWAHVSFCRFCRVVAQMSQCTRKWTFVH